MSTQQSSFLTEPTTGEIFHIFNRGLRKQQLFHTDNDYNRFLFYIMCLQSPEVSFPQPGRLVHSFVRHRMSDKGEKEIARIIKTKLVHLLTFAIMPNHFHLCLQEVKEGGISWYVQRIQNAYGRYFNIKNNSRGYVFEGRFGARHVQSNNQLLYLSTYHHRQCRELKKWKGKEDEYPWSSYQDYLHNNRWDALLDTSLILDQFSSPHEYKKFTQTSIAKAKKEISFDLFS